MSKFNLWDVDDGEVFVLTAVQLRDVAVRYALYGDKDFEAEHYEDAAYGHDGHCDTCAKEYQRMRRLQDVTAGHLVKARAELADLRLDNELMERALRRWRGLNPTISDVPAHYLGDGYVTCSRAMESASVQDAVVPRSAMQLWWWMCAFKYVWRMWSKADPIADAEKALDCLEHVKDSLEGDADE